MAHVLFLSTSTALEPLILDVAKSRTETANEVKRAHLWEGREQRGGREPAGGVAIAFTSFEPHQPSVKMKPLLHPWVETSFTGLPGAPLTQASPGVWHGASLLQSDAPGAAAKKALSPAEEC